jgi:hypothetical protein
MDLILDSPIINNSIHEAVVSMFSQAQFDYWKDTPNTLAWRAAREGRLYDCID